MKSRMREKVSAPITITRRAGAGLDQRVGLGEREDEAGADRLDVEGEAAAHADRALHLDRGRGEGLVGRRGGDDQRVDVGAGQPGVGERGAGGGDGEVGGRLALGGEVAPLDAGAGADPLVGGVEGRGELGVLDDARGQVVAAAERHGAQHAHVGNASAGGVGRVLGGADRDPRRELLGEAVVGEGEGELDRRRDAGGVGRPVRLDHRAVQPEEHAAVDPARVDALLQPLERGEREERADAAERAVGEGLASGGRWIILAVPSPVFSATLPVKPSVTITSTRSDGMSLPST